MHDNVSSVCFFAAKTKWVGCQFASCWELSFERFFACVTLSMELDRMYGGPTCCVLCVGSSQSFTMQSRVQCTGGCRRTWRTGCGQLDIQVAVSSKHLCHGANRVWRCSLCHRAVSVCLSGSECVRQPFCTLTNKYRISCIRIRIRIIKTKFKNSNCV